jgi:hypothetical protein
MQLQLAGWNFPAAMARSTEYAAGGETDAQDLFGTLRPAGAENVRRIPLGDAVEGLEREPNDRPGEAQEFPIPGAMTGRLEHGDDEDRYRFQAQKGVRLQWAVQSASLGFPVDAWLKIENTNGTQVARSEGGNGQDPELSWTPGSDATFYAVVGSLVHRGGSNDWYRVSATRPGPDFTVTSPEHSFVWKRGATNDCKITVTRTDGFTNRLTLRATGLPEGVTAAPIEVSAKGGECTVQAMVATNSPPFQGVIGFVAVAGDASAGGDAKEPRQERAASYSFVSKSENNGVPGGYRDLVVRTTERLWLTIPEPPPAKKAEKAEKK